MNIKLVIFGFAVIAVGALIYWLGSTHPGEKGPVIGLLRTYKARGIIVMLSGVGSIIFGLIGV